MNQLQEPTQPKLGQLGQWSELELIWQLGTSMALTIVTWQECRLVDSISPGARSSSGSSRQQADWHYMASSGSVMH